MKIDSYDIARMLGISQATVSRTFSRPELVSDATRARVMEAAESLGYTPDRNASALRRKGSGTIVLLYIKREDDHYWTNERRNYWLFSDAVLALTRLFEASRYSLEILQVHSVFGGPTRRIRNHCDGLIVFDYVTREEAQAIQEWKVPSVFCHRTMHLGAHNYAATDNLAGGRLQASYLRERGARHPIFVTNREDPFSHGLRERGFAEVYPEGRVINTDNRQQAAAELCQALDSGSADGLAFVNDLLLVQMTIALTASGIQTNSVPMVGYDNSTVLMALQSRPATIEIGIPEIYKAAAEALIELIDGDRSSISLVHQPTLVPAEA